LEVTIIFYSKVNYSVAMLGSKKVNNQPCGEKLVRQEANVIDFLNLADWYNRKGGEYLASGGDSALIDCFSGFSLHGWVILRFNDGCCHHREWYWTVCISLLKV
jgi:hypothetical protein